MLRIRAWKWKLNQSNFIEMQFLNCGKCNVGLQGNMKLCMLSVQNSILLQLLGEVCSVCEMVHRGGQFWHVLPCVGLPPCVKWDLSSMFNFSSFSLKLFLIKYVIQLASIMKKIPSMSTQSTSGALLPSSKNARLLWSWQHAASWMGKVAGKLNRIFGRLPCCSGAQWAVWVFCLVKETFTGEWTKPFGWHEHSLEPLGFIPLALTWLLLVHWSLACCR